MRSKRLAAFCLVAVSPLATHAALAAPAFGLFQHGGRGTGEVGALTARANDPSALSYDPAGITALSGLQLQAGLDFNAAADTYDSATGRFESGHDINFPPHVYLTYRMKDNPFAFGLGLDSPFWYTQNWKEALFPGRFLNRRFDLTLFEVHPVVAYDLGDGWSVAGGLRYDRGTFRQGDNKLTLTTIPTGFTFFETARLADATADGLGWDVSARYADPAWGFGAVYRSRVGLSGAGSSSFTTSGVPAGVTLGGAFAGGTASESFILPPEARAGVWVAPYPELRIEADLYFEHWSSLQQNSVTYNPDPTNTGPTYTTVRNWKDSGSLRLAVEGDLTDEWILFGGFAYEKSPVPKSTIDPSFPRGDALIFGAGFSYDLKWVAFDLSFSYHYYMDANADHQELMSPAVSGTYKTYDRLASGSVHWRF